MLSVSSVPAPSFLARERTVAGPGFNRWLVPPAALAIHLSIGQAYSWSVFNAPLSQLVGVDRRVAGEDWELSSICLGRESEVHVWATELWFGASEILQSIRDAGVEEAVFPIHADARALPFATDFFDATVSLDSFVYFGTDDLYLNNLARLVKPGGLLGIAPVGLTREPCPGARAGLAASHEPARRRPRGDLPCPLAQIGVASNSRPMECGGKRHAQPGKRHRFADQLQAADGRVPAATP